jgi:hypothetical protein
VIERGGDRRAKGRSGSVRSEEIVTNAAPRKFESAAIERESAARAARLNPVEALRYE